MYKVPDRSLIASAEKAMPFAVDREGVGCAAGSTSCRLLHKEDLLA